MPMLQIHTQVEGGEGDVGTTTTGEEEEEAEGEEEEEGAETTARTQEEKERKRDQGHQTMIRGGNYTKRVAGAQHSTHSMQHHSPYPLRHTVSSEFISGGLHMHFPSYSLLNSPSI
jgi:hypothetical protein